LTAREIDGVKVILPVWHNISAAEVRNYSPMLADRLAATSSKGLDDVTDQLLQAVRQRSSDIFPLHVNSSVASPPKPTPLDAESSSFPKNMPRGRSPITSDEFVQIGRTLGEQAPRFGGLFERACSAAVLAYVKAEEARSIATKTKELLTLPLSRAKKPSKSRTITLPKERLQAEGVAEPIIATLWDTGDEYFGQARDKIPHGLGQFKIHAHSDELTPDDVRG